MKIKKVLTTAATILAIILAVISVIKGYWLIAGFAALLALSDVQIYFLEKERDDLKAQLQNA